MIYMWRGREHLTARYARSETRPRGVNVSRNFLCLGRIDVRGHRICLAHDHLYAICDTVVDGFVNIGLWSEDGKPHEMDWNQRPVGLRPIPRIVCKVEAQ